MKKRITYPQSTVREESDKKNKKNKHVRNNRTNFLTCAAAACPAILPVGAAVVPKIPAVSSRMILSTSRSASPCNPSGCTVKHV